MNNEYTIHKCQYCDDDCSFSSQACSTCLRTKSLNININS